MSERLESIKAELEAVEKDEASIASERRLFDMIQAWIREIRANRKDFYYETSSGNVIDTTLGIDEDKAAIAAKLEELREDHPSVVLLSWPEVEVAQEKYHTTKAVEVPKSKYYEMLSMLMPEDWWTYDGGSSFKVVEHLTEGLTSIYVEMGGKYYEFTGRTSLTHPEIMAKVRADIKA